MEKHIQLKEGSVMNDIGKTLGDRPYITYMLFGPSLTHPPPLYTIVLHWETHPFVYVLPRLTHPPQKVFEECTTVFTE